MSIPKFNVGDKIRTKYQIEELPAGTLGTVARVIHNSLFEVIFSTKRVNCYDGELEHAAKPTMTAMQVANGEADAGTVTLPNGFKFTTPSLNDSHDHFWVSASGSSWGVSEEDKKKRKEEGRCETCGELRPMSIHGLLDCPEHPTDTGPVKQ